MDIKTIAICCGASTILLIIYVLYRIYLAKTVGLILLSKGIKNYNVWKILTFIIGPLVVAICYFVNRKVGEAISEKMKPAIKKALRNAVIFGVISLALIPLERYILDLENAEISRISLGSNAVSYLDKDTNAYYRYDKMGNKYTMDNIDDFMYYDESGSAYIEDYDKIAYYCAKTDKTIEYSDAYINESGYIVDIENDLHEYFVGDSDSIYYDDNGNLYYYVPDCSWDEKGNLIFKNKSISDITYNDIE